jgi:hypothetical protein
VRSPHERGIAAAEPRDVIVTRKRREQGQEVRGGPSSPSSTSPSRWGTAERLSGCCRPAYLTFELGGPSEDRPLASFWARASERKKLGGSPGAKKQGLANLLGVVKRTWALEQVLASWTNVQSESVASGPGAGQHDASGATTKCHYSNRKGR